MTAAAAVAAKFCDIALTTFPIREIFSVIVTIGFFAFDYIIVPLINLVNGGKLLPDKSVRNIKLDSRDQIYVNFNRLITILFLYHTIRTCCCGDTNGWTPSGRFYSEFEAALTPERLTVKNFVQSTLLFVFAYLPVTIIIYDFVYTLFHRALHIRWLYPLIHKHHHKQFVPWRGNVDAINVHPFEYVVGEYNHLFTLVVTSILCQRFTGYLPSFFYVIVYILLAGTMSTLNHTRIDIRIPYLYSVWWHDLHHRNPPTNFGQYIMLWDWIFGWYKEESTKSDISVKEFGLISKDYVVNNQQKEDAEEEGTNKSQQRKSRVTAGSAAAAAAAAAAAVANNNNKNESSVPRRVTRGGSSSASKRKRSTSSKRK